MNPVSQPNFQHVRREVFWSLLLSLAGLLLALLGTDVSHGVMPDWFSNSVLRCHQNFVCPLCGGVRSFAYVCRLQLAEAAHSSLLGTFGSLYMILTLPLRVLLMFRPNSSLLRRCYTFLDSYENADIFLIAMAVFMCLQLTLHYLCDFTWTPLEQLMLRND